MTTLNDDDLKRRLAATELSAPAITLEAVLAQAAVEPRRRPAGMARLAVAAAVVWAAVLLAQLSADRSLNALAPVSRTAVTQQTDAAGLAQQRRLMRELLAAGDWPDEAVPSRPRTAPVPSRPGPSGGRRSGQLPWRGWEDA